MYMGFVEHPAYLYTIRRTGGGLQFEAAWTSERGRGIDHGLETKSRVVWVKWDGRTGWRVASNTQR